jgi:hypothetical protein
MRPRVDLGEVLGKGMFGVGVGGCVECGCEGCSIFGCGKCFEGQVLMTNRKCEPVSKCVPGIIVNGNCFACDVYCQTCNLYGCLSCRS